MRLVSQYRLIRLAVGAYEAALQKAYGAVFTHYRLGGISAERKQAELLTLIERDLRILEQSK
jgi:hypothetical protein